MIAGTLEIQLMAGMARLQKDMDDAKRSVGGAMSSIDKAVGIAKSALMGLGAGLSVTAFVSFAKSAINAADAMNDMSQQVGISVRDLAKYELAASQSGTTMASLAKGIKGLAGNLVEHRDALKAAGITATTADGAMKQLADVFAAMPDGLEKTTLAVKLFGKSGMEMIPMLNLGSDGLADAAEKSAAYAEQMALLAPLSDAFNDSLAEMGMQSKNVGMTLLNEVMPALVKTADAMAQADSQGMSLAETFGKGIRTAFEFVVLIASDVVFVFKGIGRELGAIAAQIVAAAHGDWAGFTAIGDAVKADADKARAELDRFQADLVNHAAKVQTAYNKRQGFGEVLKDAAAGRTLLDALTSGSKAATAAAKALADQEKLVAKAYKEALDAATKVADARKKESDAIDDYMLAESARLMATAKASEDAVITAQAEYDNQGKLKSVIAETTLARLQDQLTGKVAGSEAEASLLRQIEAQKQLIGIMQKSELRDATKKAASDMADAQKKAAEESGKYWEDALMRAFESGKGFFQSLWDTIKNTLKTQVLKVMVQGTMTATGMGAYGNAMAGGSGGNGIYDVVNGASNLNTLYGAGSQALFGGTAGASAASLLYANGVGAVGGDALGALIAANGSWAGVSAGAATGAAGAGAGAAGAGISSALAAVPVYGWIALAVLAVAAWASGKGETRSGATYDTGADGLARYQQGPSGGEIAGDAARTLFNSAKNSIEETLKMVGSQAVVTGYTAGLESSENGKGFAFAGGYIDGKGFGDSGGRDGGQFAYQTMNAEQAMAAYVNELKKSTLEALQAATDIPAIISNQLAGIDINALDQAGLDNLVAAIGGTVGAVNNFVAQINTSGIAELHDLAFSAAAGLIQFSGGLENLQTNLNAYYTNFYSAEDQRLQQIKNINAATMGSGLDAAVADAKAYRELVESWGTVEKLATEEGQKMYAALLAVAGGMAELTGGLKDTQAELDKKAQSDANANYRAELEYAQEINDRIQAKQDEIKTAWQGITDGIMSEVDRIRGSLQSGPESLAAAQAKFAIALAQTRAGDQVAGQSLPGLSQNLDSIAKAEAGSLLDYQRIMGRAANSLAGLGGALTDQYGLKPLTSEADPMVVELRGIRTTLMDGFGIKPANTQNPIVEELRTMRRENAELRDEIKGLRAESQSSAVSNSKTARLLDRLSPDGNSLQIVVAA